MSELFGLTKNDRNRLQYISDHFPRRQSSGVGTNRHRANIEAEAIPAESVPGYSGEFKVSVGKIVRNTEEEENPGEIASLELFIRNGLYEGYDNTYPYSGWILLAGKRIAKTNKGHAILGKDDYNLANIYVWHETYFHPVDGIRTTYIFTEEDKFPSEETETYTVVYDLLAVIRDGKVIQAHYGPIHIMDRYYDETVTE
mgnify:CR=1 FL=1